MSEEIENPNKIVLNLDEDNKDNNIDNIDPNNIDNIKDDNTKDIKDDKKEEIKDNDEDLAVIEIDGVSYNLDENGNAIKEDGTIFMEKDKLEDLSKEDNTDENPVEDIKKLINFNPTDESGNPIQYENTYEGFTNFFTDAIEQRSKQLYYESVNNLFEAKPFVRDIIEYEAKHGTIEGFKPNSSWEQIEIKQGDDKSIHDTIVEAELKKGNTKEDAETLYTLLKDSGKDLEFANKAKTYLINATKAEREEQAILQEQIQIQKEREAINTLNQIKDKVINKSELTVEGKTLKIPKVININDGGKIISKSPSDFLNYINDEKVFNIDNKKYKMTQFEYDSIQRNTKRTIDDDLFDAYLMFTKGDKSSLIETTLKHQEFQKKKVLFTKSFEGKKDRTNTRTNTGIPILPIK